MQRKRENFSRKRAAILAALQETDSHPCAEWIYNRLKPHYPDLSLGTVYRNLNRLLECGQAVSLGVVDGHERFDGRISPHSHILCSKCGSILDVDVEQIQPGELAALSEQTGCLIESARITFLGLCPACAGEKLNTCQAEGADDKKH